MRRARTHTQTHTHKHQINVKWTRSLGAHDRAAEEVLLLYFDMSEVLQTPYSNGGMAENGELAPYNRIEYKHMLL